MAHLADAVFDTIELMTPNQGGEVASLEGPWRVGRVQVGDSWALVLQRNDGLVVPWHNVGMLYPAAPGPRRTG